ncbi:DUF3786 domain-containing protein [Dehalogenimonas sp. THU2]|uniref:DUF3786 domain-containing protein n=1 Tax=Dehalogenimonas sp. THU2 TaxID=3151121 RepID=UPI003218BA67
MPNTLSEPLFGGYERAYSESYQLAFDRLKSSDLGGICRCSRATRRSGNIIGIRFLDREYTVDIDRQTITSETGIPGITDSLVILHYLVTATDEQRYAPHPITFKELQDGRSYYPTFFKRAIAPVIERFGSSPDALIAAAEKYCGRPTSQGDVSVRFKVFPHVNLTWVLWSGDEEFPADGTVIFDATVSNFLPIEDIAALCQSIAMKLCSWTPRIHRAII